MRMVVLTSFVSDGVSYEQGDVVDLDEKFLETGFVVKSVAERAGSESVKTSAPVDDASVAAAAKLESLVNNIKLPSLPNQSNKL